MACNCGSKAKSMAAKSAGTGSPTPAPDPARPTGSTASGASKGSTQSFTLTASGRTQSFGSRLEAEAARVRLGNGVIAPAG